MTDASLPAVLGQVIIHDRTNDNSCVAQNGFFCPDWAVDNFHRFVEPTIQHFFLVIISVGLGFVIAFALSLLGHRFRWLQPPLLAGTGILYTVPSLAFFFLLLPVTGRGKDTAIIALTAYSLQIIYRNTTAGLNNVPAHVKEAGAGMGLTGGQLLWKVELPLAIPEIIGGLRIATVSTVAIATLAVFAGGGGLGTEIYTGSEFFKTGIIIAGGLAMLMALFFDVLLIGTQRVLTPWRRVAAR